MLSTLQRITPDVAVTGKSECSTTYRHIFGPVPSRRLGSSLGVDLMPHKTCSLDCVYCECGRTTHLTVTPGDYVPLALVREELSAFLAAAPHLDYITFSGSGEPTLHSGIGEIAEFIKTNYPQYKLALLTNGTLLGQKEVRRRLLAMDLVIVSVDAASPEVFRRVNRPHSGLSIGAFEAGLVSFRDEFTNNLWAEVFLVPGCNTAPEELARIRGMLAKFRPDKVQINTLDRPGAESWVAPLTAEELKSAASFLQASELLSSVRSEQCPGEADDMADRVLAAVRRRPLTIEDISEMMGADVAKVVDKLEKMEQKKIVRRISGPRGIFFSAKQE
jgi:wyosine [tRNA(Phe)-imidazoG37] synthetase (radical SAM superfamily)